MFPGLNSITGRNVAIFFGDCVVEYEIPVPGMPTDVVLLPEELIVWCKPLFPNVTLVLLVLKFNFTPGAIFMLFLNLNPITKTSFLCLKHMTL